MPDRAADDRSAPLHSGEGYISGSGNGQPRESYRGPTTLPQAPRIQRAAQIDPAVPAMSRGRHIDSAHAMRNDVPSRASMPTRGFDRGNDVMRMPERPVYQPARAEPLRQNYQPRYAPSQRAAQEFGPQPRAESHEQRSAPSHGESHSGGHAASGGGGDSHGH
jgi:hypothetical protein